MIINLTYYHVAKDVPEVSPDIAVVIDVLRATTTISWALKNGADSIQVFADLDLLKESAINWQAEKRLMLGERGGKKIKGFDLGNSPLSVTKEVVNGKRLFMSTTNGTKSLQKVQHAKHLFADSFSKSRSAKTCIESAPFFKAQEIVVVALKTSITTATSGLISGTSFAT